MYIFYLIICILNVAPHPTFLARVPHKSHCPLFAGLEAVSSNKHVFVQLFRSTSHTAQNISKFGPFLDVCLEMFHSLEVCKLWMVQSYISHFRGTSLWVSWWSLLSNEKKNYVFRLYRRLYGIILHSYMGITIITRILIEQRVSLYPKLIIPTSTAFALSLDRFFWRSLAHLAPMTFVKKPWLLTQGNQIAPRGEGKNHWG